MRLLPLRVAALGMAAVPGDTVAQTLPPQIGQRLEYPLAVHSDTSSWEEGDITVVVDREGDWYLDGGDGHARQISQDRVADALTTALSDRRAPRVRLVADSHTDYEVVLRLLATLHDAGVRELTAITAGTGDDPRVTLGIRFLLGTAADTAVVSAADSTPVGSLFASDDAVVLGLPENGSYQLNRRHVPFVRLPGRVRGLFEKRSPTVLFLVAAGSRRYQEVITAMDVARSAGVQRPVAWLPLPGQTETRPVGVVVVWDSSGLRQRSRVYADAVVDQVPARLSCPPLQYPVKARRSRIQGNVLLEFVVETDGTVRPEMVAIVRASHKVFEQSARSMIEACRFQPGTVDGHPVRVLVSMPVVYAFTQGGAPERDGNP